MTTTVPAEARLGARRPPSFALAYVGMAFLTIVWGASFLMVKVSIQDMTPQVLVLVRVLSGGLTLYLALRITGRSAFGFDVRARLPALLLMCLLLTILPWLAIGWGEFYVSSALASVLSVTTPIWTAVLAIWLTPEERPNPANLIGVAIGFFGVLMLIAPDLLTHGLVGSVAGAVAVLVGSASYAGAAIVQRRWLANLDVVAASLWQLLLAFPFAVALAIPSLGSFHARPVSLLSALGLGAIATGLSYIVYFHVLDAVGATRATMIAYLFPVVGLVLGTTLLHEPATLVLFVGVAVIFAGVLLANWRRAGPG